MELILHPKLEERISMMYPQPTVYNPEPPPIEYWSVEDLIAVHGSDVALFVMNQLGQVIPATGDSTGGEKHKSTDDSSQELPALGSISEGEFSSGISSAAHPGDSEMMGKQQTTLTRVSHPASDEKDAAIQALTEQVATLTSQIVRLGQQFEAVIEAQKALDARGPACPSSAASSQQSSAAAHP